MAESPKNRRSSSSSSDEEIVGGDGSGVELENREASGGIGTNNDGIIDRSLPREKTLPAETSNADKLESTSNGHKLETSKTVRRRHNIVGEEAAQIFDDRISVQKKLKLLNLIATLKDDGTIEFEVQEDVKSHGLDFGIEDIYNEAVGEEPLDSTDLQYIPPLQIVMLIVGTRGDVQPFIAIGKRLQDIHMWQRR